MDTAGSGSRGTLHHSGLLLPQAPLCACFSFDQLWRHTQGLRKHAAHLSFTPHRLEALMVLQQNVMAQRVYESSDSARLSWQASLRDLQSSEERQAAALLAVMPEVCEQSQRWWAVACEEAAIHEEPTVQGISRRGFFRLHALLSRALLPECAEQRALLRSAKDDWLGLQAAAWAEEMADGVARPPTAAALQARTHLSRERFEAAVLELAQVRSPSHHALAPTLTRTRTRTRTLTP
jgi:hypothetical protein